MRIMDGIFINSTAGSNITTADTKFYDEYMYRKEFWDEKVTFIADQSERSFEGPRYFQMFAIFGLKGPLDPLKHCISGMIDDKPIVECFLFDIFGDNVIHIVKSHEKSRSETSSQKKQPPENVWRYLHPYHLNVYIDITVPLKKIQEKLKQEISSMLDSLEGQGMRPRSRESEYIKHIYTPRSREYEWINYIIAYDLKEKYSLKTIAEILLPEEVKDNEYPEYPTSKKIGRFIKSAENLIEKDGFVGFFDLKDFHIQAILTLKRAGAS